MKYCLITNTGLILIHLYVSPPSLQDNLKADPIQKKKKADPIHHRISATHSSICISIEEDFKQLYNHHRNNNSKNYTNSLKAVSCLEMFSNCLSRRQKPLNCNVCNFCGINTPTTIHFNAVLINDY